MLNKVMLIGNVCREVEVSQSKSGSSYGKFSIAVNEWGKDEPTFFNIIVFGKTAEACGKFVSKGSKIYIEGRMECSKWEDKEGNKRQSWSVTANQVQFLDTKPKSNVGGGDRNYGKSTGNDVPF